MFSLTLENPDILKNSMSIISEMIDEAALVVNSNGISLLSPDRNVIIVVDFKLLSTAFQEFKVDNDTSIGLNFSNFVGILKRAKSTDKLTLKLKDNNKLEVIIEGNGVRRFELPLLDIKTEKPPIDQLDFSGKVDLESSVLEQGVDDADVVSDSLVFELNPDALRLSAKGDISSTQLEINKNDSGLLSLDAKEAVKSRYPLDYLKKIIKACKLSKQVSLEMGTNYPVRFSFKDVDKMNLSFILAPRVSDDD